jgi:hypothetical protein
VFTPKVTHLTPIQGIVVKLDAEHDALHETQPRARHDPSRHASKGEHCDDRRNEPIRADAEGTNHGHEQRQQQQRPQAELIPAKFGFWRAHVRQYGKDSRNTASAAHLLTVVALQMPWESPELRELAA